MLALVRSCSSAARECFSFLTVGLMFAWASLQVAGCERFISALHEARLWGHLIRHAGGQRVLHQNGLQRHRDQAWCAHRQSEQVSRRQSF